MEIRLEIDQSKLDYDEINKKLLEKIDGLSSEDVLRFAYPKTYMGFYGGGNFPEDESNNLTELITERLISSIMMQEDGNDFKVFDENNGKLTYKGLDMVTREFQNVFLTNSQFADLQALYPRMGLVYIERLSQYMASTGKNYRNHYATIKSWIAQDSKKSPASKFDYSYTYEEAFW